MIRKPNVNGTFYSGDSAILNKELDHYFANVGKTSLNRKILGIISPHAGYVYSGQCAAYSYQSISQQSFKTAVILAPSHRYGHFKFSVGNYESYLTPLGEVKVDQERVRRLLDDPDFTFYPAAHAVEHSLEVQLPFLQKINKTAKIVPILLGQQSVENSILLADKLKEDFQHRLADTIFIISSDLSHYHMSETARKMDHLLIELFLENRVEDFGKAIINRKIEACGFGGIMCLMELAKKLSFQKFELLNYSHSGMISGDIMQVVGYLSAVVYQ